MDSSPGAVDSGAAVSSGGLTDSSVGIASGPDCAGGSEAPAGSISLVVASNEGSSGVGSAAENGLGLFTASSKLAD